MSKILYSLKSIHKVIKENKPSQVCLVTSKGLSKKLAWAIREINIPRSQIILVPDGEKVKDWKETEKLLQKFIKLGLDRKSIVVVLGGGTIGDSVGFAASIYLRGIKYIQVPTTLLAQVDSAHGGKTGINFSNYKNQVGSFYLPVATIIEPRFIKSLTKELIVEGLGEIIKYGLIKDVSILSVLKKHTTNTLVKSSDLTKIIRKSIAVKEYATGRDFKEDHLRKILNFGHTFGHAIELKYNISHGQAVTIGMIQELMFTEWLGFTAMSVRENLEGILENLGIKPDISMEVDWKTLIHDKKVSGAKIALPVIEKAGIVRLINIDLDLINTYLFTKARRLC